MPSTKTSVRGIFSCSSGPTWTSGSKSRSDFGAHRSSADGGRKRSVAGQITAMFSSLIPSPVIPRHPASSSPCPLVFGYRCLSPSIPAHFSLSLLILTYHQSARPSSSTKCHHPRLHHPPPVISKDGLWDEDRDITRLVTKPVPEAVIGDISQTPAHVLTPA